MDAARPMGSEADALAEGFATHAERWARESGATAEAAAALRRVARGVSLATSAGHVCAELDELAASADGGPAPGRLRELLLASHVVGTAQAPSNKPLVVDADGRVYLHRYFDFEQRLARRLLAALGTAGEPPAAARAALRRLFAAEAPASRPPVGQQVAAGLALLGRFTVISGGPGTGKTTTVVKLLACLLAADPACRIALAAPTGKAAARMLEALRLRAAQLPAALRDALPTEAFTVHRLLGVTGESGRFRHHAAQPLAIDALVVDEASMLDLALATRLFEAVPSGARIVLLGDKDQLAAVEAGAVFAELSADPRLSAARIDALADLCGLPRDAVAPPEVATPGAGLQDSVVWLRENFRFGSDSAIGRLATAINRGDADAAIEQLAAAGDDTLRWIDAGRRPALEQIVDGYGGFLAAVQARPDDPRAVSEAFAHFRVLCAVHRGPRGVDAVNALMARRMHRAARSSPAGDWYAGRPVMVLRNDYRLGLYNGDTGIALPGADGRLVVWFEDGRGGFRAIAPLRLPEHQSAFAITVHKAQGSEYDELALLLPVEAGRGVSRELLYTGLTRARRRATLVATAAGLRQAIETPTRRHSGLLARLREQAAK